MSLSLHCKYRRCKFNSESQSCRAQNQLELRYFDYNTRGAPTNLKGRIELKSVTSVSASKAKEPKGDEPPMIELNTEGRVYRLRADSHSEHEYWLQALTLAVRVATGQQDWPQPK